MYTKTKPKRTTIKVNKSYKGETIEQKINRIVNNKEPITDGAPIIFTDRKDGVQAQYDIRTDRFEIAVEAMDAVTKTNLAKREQALGERTYDMMNDTQQAEFDKKYPNNKYAQEKTRKNDSGAKPTPDNAGQ